MKFTGVVSALALCAAAHKRAAPIDLRTSLPASTGTVVSAAAIVVSNSFDGKMNQYERSSMSLTHYPARVQPAISQ